MVCHDIPKYYNVKRDTSLVTEINFNYNMFLAMDEIIKNKDCPLIAYYKFYIFAFMTLHDIVVKGQKSDFNEIRNEFLKHKDIILSTPQMKNSKGKRLKMLILSISPKLYRNFLKFKFVLNKIIHFQK